MRQNIHRTDSDIELIIYEGKDLGHKNWKDYDLPTIVDLFEPVIINDYE